MIDLGKIFIEKNGAGRMYIPKTIIKALEASNKEQMILHVIDGELTAIATKKI